MIYCSVPKNYKSMLTLKETQIAIKKIKDFFERQLAVELNLTRVSAPIFVPAQSGLNDNLNGHERPVSFDTVCDTFSSSISSKSSFARFTTLFGSPASFATSIP